MTGTLPESWSSMTHVGYVNLSDNHLTGSLPESWSSMQNIGTLWLSSNELNGSLPKSWALMTEIRYMFLQGHELGGTLPSAWSMMNITSWELNLESNLLKGHLPPEWRVLSGLVLLGLSFNSLSGGLPASWGNFEHLSYLSFQGNQLTGTLPSTWSNFISLEYFNVEGNVLQGPLPSLWSTWQSLKYLDVSSNRLQGSIPKSWSNQTQVQVARFHNNCFCGAIPQMANTTLMFNASVNMFTDLSCGTLPASLRLLHLAKTKLNISVSQLELLPASLQVLDLSDNLLSGPLPQALPTNLSIVHISNNYGINSSLPSQWSRLAELKLDNTSLTGSLPQEWHTWGSDSNNSVQISILNNQLGGGIPQKWVYQFCLAVVCTSQEQVLFIPPPFVFYKDWHSSTVTVSTGSAVILVPRHASINVTLEGKLYTFSYDNPDSICSIPNALRNAALLWGIFAMLLLVIVVSVHCCLRRKTTLTQPRLFTKLTVLSFLVQHNQRIKLTRHVVASLWVFLSDVVWFIYSQVTDVFAIHQVFASGHWGYAVLLLATLLLTYLLEFLLVVRVWVRFLKSHVACESEDDCTGWLCKLAFVVVAIAASPFLFLALQIVIVADAVGMPVVGSVCTFCELSSLYRAKSVMESFFNALPQAIIQTKLYVVGNDPNGIGVYINTTIFMTSVLGSLVSILNSVPMVMIEVFQYGKGVYGYFRQLIDLGPFYV